MGKFYAAMRARAYRPVPLARHQSRPFALPQMLAKRARTHGKRDVIDSCRVSASSNYPVFKGPATLYVLKMTPDGIAFVLTSSNVRGGVPSAKKRFPAPNRTG